MATPQALHSKKTPKWGTPEEIAIRGRMAMGGEIHCDPASSPEFNARIGALRIITEAEDGLRAPWVGEGLITPIRGINLFLNPPGGLVTPFWVRLIREWAEGNVARAIWIGFSVEQLCTLQDADLWPMDFSTCVLRKRLSFTQESGETGGSPSHGNYITGIGVSGEIFATCFGDLGRIVSGSMAVP